MNQAEELEQPDNSAEGQSPETGTGRPDTAALAEEAAKYRDIALRSQAELENFRKRMIREKEDSLRYANTTLLERLLPILDNFELGLQAAANSNSPEASGIAEGFSMVQKQLQDFLRDSGVEAVPSTGIFDPNMHEAVAQQASDVVAEGEILQQLRKGYKLRDRLLRPATVVVSKGPEVASAE